jgi:Dihydrodipicolinate synthetase family
VKEIASGGQTLLCGVYAALPTPLGDGGQPDVASLDALIEFLLGSGVSGFCVGGVTGEYPQRAGSIESAPSSPGVDGLRAFGC